MSISVVIPSHNARAYLGQTVESVIAQTFTDWQLIIIDDGSTDSTASIAQEYAQRDSRIRVVSQANRGIAGARNRGLTAASAASEFVIFLDHDDLWERNSLEMLLGTLHAHPEAVASHGLSRTIDTQSQQCRPGQLEAWGRYRRGVVGKHLVPWAMDQPTTLAVLAFRNYIWSPGQVLIRRSALTTVGPFEPTASPCDDWDMWLRLSRQGCIAYIDCVVLNWREHGSNTSRDTQLLGEKEYFVRRKLVASRLSEEQRQTVLMANRFWTRYVCSEQWRWAKRQFAHHQPVQALGSLRRASRAYFRCLRGLPAT